MKLFAVIALAAGALALSAASTPAGAAPASLTGFNCISSCAAYEATINQYFTDVAHDSGLGTNVYSTLAQYSTPSTTIAYDVTFDAATNTYVDGNPYPATKCHDDFDKYCVTDKQLQTEIANVIAKKHWPTNTTTALYFIFTPANVGVCDGAGYARDGLACTTNVFCAYHWYTDSFIYGVEPDNAAVSDGACNTGQTPAGSDADATLSTVSHEQSEAITDPYGDGWTSEDHETFMGIPNAFFGSENGDLCAWNFGAPLGTTLDGQQYNQVINGHDYFLQQEYSNADGGCVQYAGGTATNFKPHDPFYSGTGPLVYHDGFVMPSNTIYAIYWVPAKPVNNRPPTIAGIAKVGNRLKAFHGSWSNLPILTYRWLRCSAAGTSCRSIKGATASTHRLVAADAGHRLKIRITAKNIAGRASATSAATPKVKR
ncbi:MAG: hypothetical protein QOG85_2434 [Gaiellaceae bacterium]|nr:hypothetical protein [Gaiellaceae bacterium]